MYFFPQIVVIATRLYVGVQKCVQDKSSLVEVTVAKLK